MLKDSTIESIGEAVAAWQLYLQDFEAGPTSTITSGERAAHMAGSEGPVSE
jgi:hypothetical protein